MKTDDLIRAITADGERMSAPFRTAMAAALAAGALASTLIFVFWMGPRPDFAQALLTIRFPFKVFVVVLLAAAALGLSMRMGRPGARILPWLLAGISAVGILLAGAAAELFVLPQSAWLANLNGANRFVCLVVIPSLGALPLALALAGLRYGAPTHPALAGAAAGLAAGGIAATLYALNCNNDSPLFVAVWYPIAIGTVVLAGALAGSRFLRW
jgi:hypothetical protein